ncbi:MULTISPECIES: hypothetical protein [unclassified Desulfovibrio]|uniref:hypothetical protein n=1 Tax=unclassified Desulfovibrio TaxID=2593640 RepID=UPI0013E9D3BD|nr:MULTISPECIES: hypothetical protein [unclassified Desulfovibrio]
MKRIFSFLGGALAGAGVLAAVACMVTRLTEEAAPRVGDVNANGAAARGDDAAAAPDNSAESA